MSITVCPDCDGQKLMPGYDCDCPRCDASGVVEMQSHVGYSRENECWFARFFPFGSEAHAKAFEERIQSPIPHPTLEAIRAILDDDDADVFEKLNEIRATLIKEGR